jgi:uncharacterized protein
VDIKCFKNATEFLARAEKHLAKDEARYGLALGIAKAAEINPHHYGQEDAWFCIVATGKKINATGWRTPPHLVGLAYFSGDTKSIAGKVAEEVARAFPSVPGVVGDKELADAFTGEWCRKRGVKITGKQAQRLYRLDKVNDVPLAPGRFRVATAAEKGLVKEWSHAFHADTFGEGNNIPETDLSPGVDWGTVFFWEMGGRPVSMAGKNRPTEHGTTVGGVYTPPEHRNRGYATSCVAELSRHILESGKDFCTLYTDLANPTSNSIYMKIGYKPIADSAEYLFEM